MKTWFILFMLGISANSICLEWPHSSCDLYTSSAPIPPAPGVTYADGMYIAGATTYPPLRLYRTTAETSGTETGKPWSKFKCDWCQTLEDSMEVSIARNRYRQFERDEEEWACSSGYSNRCDSVRLSNGWNPKSVQGVRRTDSISAAHERAAAEKQAAKEKAALDAEARRNYEAHQVYEWTRNQEIRQRRLFPDTLPEYKSKSTNQTEGISK